MELSGKRKDVLCSEKNFTFLCEPTTQNQVDFKQLLCNEETAFPGLKRDRVEIIYAHLFKIIIC